MIAAPVPYAALRDAGAPWIGPVPGHWDVVRARHLVREIDRRSAIGTETHLSMSQKLGLVPVSDVEQKTLVSETYAGAKLVERDDLVLNRLKAHLGVFALATQPGVVSPDYTVLRRTRTLSMRYLEYVLRSAACRVELRQRTKGIVEGFWRLYTDDFYDIRLPVPPVAEQEAIVRFLDHADRRVRRYIAAKQKLIALLNEEKQVIVNQAVTRGIDHATRLRPSGVDWVGDVPEHWVAPHLRYLAQCLDGTRVPLNAVQRGAMQGDVPYWGANRVIDYVRDWLFDEPLVILGEDGAPFLEPGRDVAFFVSGKVWVNNHAHVLRCGSRLVPRFLVHVLNCVDYIGFVDGSTRSKLTQQAMGSIPIQLPPLAEQVAIVGYIDEQTSGLKRAATRAHQQLELVREFRTRLIAEVGTGKLDVREAAAQLPNEVEEPDQLGALMEDDSEDSVDPGIAAGEADA